MVRVARARVGERREDRARVVGAEQAAHDRADHAGTLAAAVPLDERVQAVLSGKAVGYVAVAKRDPYHAPIARPSSLREPVEVRGLVGTVEAAHAEVDDRRCERAAIVGGKGDAAQARAQGALAEARQTHSGGAQREGSSGGGSG
jgi:hypothetical protein